MKRMTTLFLFGALLCTYASSFSQTNPKSTNQKTNAIMKNARPFKIEVSQSILDDLQARLKQTRWTDEPKDAGWSYGMNPKYLRELVAYWQTKYDWRKQEAMLNQF